jgi:uncharacterized damage-inducible protein DinB
MIKRLIRPPRRAFYAGDPQSDEEVPVKLTELLIADLDRETSITKRALEAVPDGRDEWKPHPKSMALGRLAGLVALMPSWLTMMITQDEFDVAPATPPAGGSQFTMPAHKDLAATVDKSFAGARAALAGTTDEHLLKPWRLKARGNVVAEGTRLSMMRDALMHLSHHRGQLTVYLRLNEVPVPAIYGPTADDPRF